MTDSTRRHDTLALAVLAAVVTLVFADVLLGINALYVRDLAHYHYPSKHVLRELILAGEFPHWNPYFGAGQPMAANPQHEVFYPLTWLILLPSYRIGFHLLILIHLYIAAFGMYALLRSMQTRAPAAFFGALAFTLGGVIPSYLNLLPFLFTTAWLPLTCLYARRFFLTHSRRDFALASFFLGLQLIIGEPTTILQTGVLLGLFAVYQGAGGRAQGAGDRIPALLRPVPCALRPLLQLALICIAALLLSAVQMLPAIDHASDSVRARGFPFENITSWSTPPARLGEVLYPNLHGHIDLGGRRVYWGAALYGERSAPFLYTIYPGLLLGVLAIAGVFARVRGRWLLLTIGALSTLLALGAHTPLWRLLYDLGLARSLRYPEKFLLMGFVALIVFGAKALDELLAGDARVRKAALRTSAVVTAFAVLAATVAHTPLYPKLFAMIWSTPTPVMLAASAGGWLVAAARGGIVFVLIRNAAQRTAWLALAGLFVLLDLGMILFEVAPRMPARYYDEPPPLAQQLPANRAQWRLFHHADWHKRRDAVQPYFARHPDLFWIHRNAMFPTIPARYGIRLALDADYDLTSLTPTADFVQSVADLSDLRRDWVDVAASMSNVWYRLVFRAPAEAFAEARGDRRVVQPVGILSVGHNPRYYFADDVETIADRADFVRKLASVRSGRRMAFVEEPSFQPAPGRVLRVSETASGARIEVETRGRAFLVISVTPHKYWRLTVDDRPAEAVVTNVGYQGVIVPAAGRHVIAMRYRNPLFAIGGTISVVALIALLAIGRRR